MQPKQTQKGSSMSAIPAEVSRNTVRDAPRGREAELGGLRLKLSVPQRLEGMHLFFQNDTDDGAIEQLLSNGFSFVLKSEVGLGRKSATVVADDDITDRVSRFVGRNEDGTPMRAYLMKCAEEVWEAMQDRSLAEAGGREDTLNQAVTNPDSREGRYKPGRYNGSSPQF